MTSKTLGAVLVAAVVVASVAFVGPALAHGDAPTQPTNETTANETPMNQTAPNATWTGHANAWDRGQWPTWMGGHVSQNAYGWMASHMGYGPQSAPNGQVGPGHGPGFASGPDGSTQYSTDTHPSTDQHTDSPYGGQYDDRQQTQWGTGDGYGC